MLNADNPKGYDIKEGWKGKIDESGKEQLFATEDEYDEYLEEYLPKAEDIGDN